MSESYPKISKLAFRTLVPFAKTHFCESGFSTLYLPIGIYQNGIYSFPAWWSAFMGGCREQAGKLAYCVLGQGT